MEERADSLPLPVTAKLDVSHSILTFISILIDQMEMQRNDVKKNNKINVK